MKTFTIKHTIPCYVDFIYRVEAEDEEEAHEAFYNSQADYVRENVGETIQWVDHDSIEITEGEPGAKSDIREEV